MRKYNMDIKRQTVLFIFLKQGMIGGTQTYFTFHTVESGNL